MVKKMIASVVYFNSSCVLYNDMLHQHIRARRNFSQYLFEKKKHFLEKVFKSVAEAQGYVFLTRKAPPIFCSRRQFQFLLLFQK